MRARRDRLTLDVRAFVGLGALAAVAWIVYGLSGSEDYQIQGPVKGDNAGPAVAALAHGHLAAVASAQPLMGLVSIVWRAPFAGAAMSLAGSHQLAYQLGTFACLLPIAGVLLWLAGRVESRAQVGAAVVAAVVILAGPVTLQAAQIGHPEEVLATVLTTGAVISAGQDRRGWAAALLGLAIGTKPWAALAMPCVLLALPRGRALVGLTAAAIALPAIALLPLADPAAFGRADRFIGGLSVAVPSSIWWPVAGRQLTSMGVAGHLLPLSLTRSVVMPLVLAVGVTAIWTYGRRLGRGRLPTVDGLALLALIGLLRCLADPAPEMYYFLPVVIPLALWEAGTLSKPPILSVLGSAALALFQRHEVPIAAGRGQVLAVLNILWLAGVAALGVYLLRRAFRPDASGWPRREAALLAPATDAQAGV